MKTLTRVIAAVLAVVSIQTVTAQNKDYAGVLAECAQKSIMNITASGCLVGIPAPDFTATAVDGKTISLNKLKGKVVVLNFWFIACTPCQVEAPVLKKIAAQFEKDDVVFISIAREKQADLEKYLKSDQFFANNIADPASAVCKDVYRVLGFPTTIVIGRDGRIQYYTLGGRVTEDAASKDLHEKLVPQISEALNKPVSK